MTACSITMSGARNGEINFTLEQTVQDFLDEINHPGPVYLNRGEPDGPQHLQRIPMDPAMPFSHYLGAEMIVGRIVPVFCVEL
jgi:hypothetical protein